MSSAWERLQLVRDPSRKRAKDILDAILVDTFELHGDRMGADDAQIVVRLGSLGSPKVRRRIVAVGCNGGRITPSGYRKAIRAFEMAGRLGLPVLTLVDTRGADPLPASEAGGIAAAIARTFEAMLACPSPTIGVVTGEGGSGGGLALCVADRVFALSNAVFSVIAPEGAAAILYRDAGRAPELAERLKITAADLAAFSLVDGLIPEEGGVWEKTMAETVAAGFESLTQMKASSRLKRRSERWREVGSEHLGHIAR